MSHYESTMVEDNNFKNDIDNKNDIYNFDKYKSKPKIPFWSEDPNVILNTNFIFEFFPSETMTYSQKLNAISRLIILLTVISIFIFGFNFSRTIRILLISGITLYAIYLCYAKQHSLSRSSNIEGFSLQSSPATDMLNEKNINVSSDVFMEPTVENPFSNVLLSDYDYNTNKKPAPPISNMEVEDKILNQAKTLVQKMNPNQPNISDKLFRDLGEQFVFEQSLRPFYSNANTTIPNDQSAFADFCYGSMISCKEGNLFACARNNASRHINQ
jgi:hypothetical protein